MKAVQVLSLFCSMLLTASASFAAETSGAVNLGSGDLFQIRYGGKTYTCGHIKNSWIPGRFVKNLFLSTSKEISNINKILKGSLSTSKRNLLKSKLQKLKASLPSGTSVCKEGPRGGTGGGGNSLFDSMGNVTAAGKAAFQIPSNISANVSRGIATWKTVCFGCHQTSPAVLGPSSFSAIKARIQLAPMFFSIPSEVTEQEIADITAYRNY